MNKNGKRITTKIIIILIISLIMVQPLYAVNPQVETLSIEPRWQNAATVNLVLNLNNPQISVSVSAIGRTGTTFSSGTLTLEKISGTGCGVVEQWTGISSTNMILQFSDTSATRTKGTYRLTFTVTAILNGTTEVIEVSRESTYPAS